MDPSVFDVPPECMNGEMADLTDSDNVNTYMYLNSDNKCS